MDSSFPLVEVFILSYNRPEYILQTIDSVLKQTYPNLRIIVSDNSSKDEVQTKLQGYIETSKITYLHRKPSLPALAHFNAVLLEATSDYFMIFHDDDVLLPEAITKLVTAIKSDPNIAAVAGNAFILEETTFTQNIFDPILKTDLRLEKPEDLALHYLDSNKGHVPFPSYLYQKAKIENLKMIFKEGQKHSDVSFLIKACQQGPFVWLKDPVMYYRRHSSNDSVSLDVPAIFSLCRFLGKNTKVPTSIVNQYKMKSYILWTKQRRSKISKSLSPWRDRVIINSALYYASTHPSIFLRAVLKRLAKRFNTQMQPPNNPQ